MSYIDIHTHQNSNKINCFIKSVALTDILFEMLPNINYSIGIHPWYIPKNPTPVLSFLKKNITSQQILAIGEIGLDFQKKILETNSKSCQIDIFEQQISIAKKNKKPIIIHCVKAWDELIAIKQQKATATAWIVHGFSKNKFLAKQLLQHGFYLSFGANIIKNSSNAATLKTMPLDKIFLETDDQTTYNIQDIYTKAANILNMPLPELTQIITQNYQKVFGNCPKIV